MGTGEQWKDWLIETLLYQCTRLWISWLYFFLSPTNRKRGITGALANRKTAASGSESADLARVLLCYGGQQPLLWGNRQITNILHLLFSLGSSLFFKKTKLFWGKDKLQFSSSKQIKSNCFLLCSKSNKTSLKVEREICKIWRCLTTARNPICIKIPWKKDTEVKPVLNVFLLFSIQLYSTVHIICHAASKFPTSVAPPIRNAACQYLALTQSGSKFGMSHKLICLLLLLPKAFFHFCVYRISSGSVVCGTLATIAGIWLCRQVSF